MPTIILENNQVNLLLVTVVTDSKFKVKCGLVIFPFCFGLLFRDGHCITLIRMGSGRERERAPIA